MTTTPVSPQTHDEAAPPASKISPQTYEALRDRAQRYGDPFEADKKFRYLIRCFDPAKHQNGDAHPSARWVPGRYVACAVCGFKECEKKLHQRLGIVPTIGGLTLEALAEAKKLPVDYLATLGLRTGHVAKRAVVLIPWYGPLGLNGSVAGYHRRHRIDKDGDGPRWTWDLPKRAALIPFGAELVPQWLDEAHSGKIDPYVWVVESETDALTLRLHGMPAVGYGGAEFWRGEWAVLLAAFARILVAEEPDEAGHRAALRVAADLVKTCQQAKVSVVKFPADLKDPNGVHLAVVGEKAAFLVRIKELVDTALDAKVLVAEDEKWRAKAAAADVQKEREAETAAAQKLLYDPAVFHKAIHTAEDLGVVGERRNAGIVRLCVRSRSLSRPANLEVNSPSSAGKSHIVHTVLQLEDPRAFWELTATSQKALLYTDEPLDHRIVFIQEPEGLAEGVGFAAIKVITWESRLRYVTVEKPHGELVARTIEKEGPTGLIVSTTKPLEEQLTNRLVRIEVDTSEAQTRRVLGVVAASVNGDLPKVDLKPWHAMSRLLGGPARVRIVFAAWLAGHVSVKAHRVRRDFTHLLTFIGASAIEHSFQRSREVDGRLVANLQDYAVAHHLVGDAFKATQAEGIVPEDRAMVAKLATLSREKPSTQAILRAALGLSKSSSSYRLNRLLRLGYISNQADKGKPMQLVIGAPLPEEAPPLPTPCQLAEELLRIGREDLIVPMVNPVDGSTHDCFSHISGKSARLCSTPFEPCSRCVSGPKLDGRGFISEEPLEPPLNSENPGNLGSESEEEDKGFKEVQPVAELLATASSSHAAEGGSAAMNPPGSASHSGAWDEGSTVQGESRGDSSYPEKTQAEWGQV
ncbi:MAG: hypothetical protein FJ312_07940 [SAR202 cluster bacterium]|nr:hypothetical protein [SAR202 cluster bacterium]